MKRMVFSALALLLALCFVACNEGAATSSALPEEQTAASVPTSAEPAPAELPAPKRDPLPVAEGWNALTGLPLAEGVAPGQRPVALMVANDERALPQRGLASADVVYEMLTEGGITRLMALYGDAAAVPTTGPMRSTRDQFVQFALPQNAVMVHIGSSVYARNLLTVKHAATIDGIHLGNTAFGFDTARNLPKPGGKLNEYCWFTDAALISAGMQAEGIQPAGEVRSLFNFAQQPAAPGAEAHEVAVAYSKGGRSRFRYNVETGLYAKLISGKPHTDEDGTQLTFTNLVLLACPIGLKPDGRVAEFDLREGSGWYFTAGAVTPITWEKGAPEDALRLFGPDGAELPVQPGKSYIGVVPAENSSAVRWFSDAEVAAADAEKAAAAQAAAEAAAAEAAAAAQAAAEAAAAASASPPAEPPADPAAAPAI